MIRGVRMIGQVRPKHLRNVRGRRTTPTIFARYSSTKQSMRRETGEVTEYGKLPRDAQGRPIGALNLILRAFGYGALFTVGAMLTIGGINYVFGGSSVYLVDKDGKKIDRAGLIRSRGDIAAYASAKTIDASGGSPSEAVLAGIRGRGKPPLDSIPVVPRLEPNRPDSAPPSNRG